MNDPDEPVLKIDTNLNKRDQTFNITVTMRSIDSLTEKQASVYLKGLIANALKSAVMEKYGSIQSLVDEVVYSSYTRSELEKIIREEFVKKAAEHVKDMFG